MKTKEELESQRDDWAGKNIYLWDEARGKIKDKQYIKKKEVKLPTFDFYKKKTMKQLRNIAKRRKLKGYSAWHEDSLIEKLMELDRKEDRQNDS